MHISTDIKIFTIKLFIHTVKLIENSQANTPIDDEISGSGDDELSGSGNHEPITEVVPNESIIQSSSTTSNDFFFSSTVSPSEATDFTTASKTNQTLSEVTNYRGKPSSACRPSTATFFQLSLVLLVMVALVFPNLLFVDLYVL